MTKQTFTYVGIGILILSVMMYSKNDDPQLKGDSKPSPMTIITAIIGAAISAYGFFGGKKADPLKKLWEEAMADGELSAADLLLLLNLKKEQEDGGTTGALTIPVDAKGKMIKLPDGFAQMKNMIENLLAAKPLIEAVTEKGAPQKIELTFPDGSTVESSFKLTPPPPVKKVIETTVAS